MSEPPACPAPAAGPHPPRGVTLPRGAVDTHAHVIGAPPAYPFVADRSYTPPPASPGAYLDMLDATGVDRGVLIQVSVHGSDNRLLLETLRPHPDRLRGVAVMPHNLAEGEYLEAHAAGVRGLRLNVLFGGGIGFEALERYDDLVAERGWHLQLLVDARDLPDLAPRLARLRAPIVIDHMGHMPVSLGLDHPGFQTLIALVRDGAWVKLSGAFRLSDQPDWADTIPVARALFEAAPDRCVWGSDWPHVAHWGRMMQVAELLELLARWAPDEAARRRILVDNPERLYGFAPWPDHAQDA
jgi:predicted TIM-barrel fold metal-dependent hydrolase